MEEVHVVDMRREPLGTEVHLKIRTEVPVERAAGEAGETGGAVETGRARVCA